jgi:hypothetical protein
MACKAVTNVLQEPAVTVFSTEVTSFTYAMKHKQELRYLKLNAYSHQGIRYSAQFIHQALTW